MLKSRDKRTSPFKQNFDDACAGQKITSKQFVLLHKHASLTGKIDLIEKGTKFSDLYGFWCDAAAKKASHYSGLKDEMIKENLIDIIIMSKWDAHNFELVHGIKLPQKTPLFPADPKEIKDIQTMIAYMDRSIAPEIRKTLIRNYGFDDKTLDVRIKQRESELKKQGMEGIEVFSPIPSASWLKASLK